MYKCGEVKQNRTEQRTKIWPMEIENEYIEIYTRKHTFTSKLIQFNIQSSFTKKEIGIGTETERGRRTNRVRERESMVSHFVQ